MNRKSFFSHWLKYKIVYAIYSSISQSVLRQVRSVCESVFSTECDLLLPLPNFSRFFLSEPTTPTCCVCVCVCVCVCARARVCACVSLTRNWKRLANYQKNLVRTLCHWRTIRSYFIFNFLRSVIIIWRKGEDFI
jgi:hypothetical protein